MKTWGVVDTVTVVCLLLAVVPYGSRCNSEAGDHSVHVTSDAHDPVNHKGANISDKVNVTSASSAAPKATSTVTSVLQGVSSREGVTKASSQEVPKAVSSHEVPQAGSSHEVPKARNSMVQVATPHEPPKLLNGTLKEGISEKKDVLNWMEGGGHPHPPATAHQPKDTPASSGPHSSNPSKSDGGAKTTTMKPHKNVVARKGAVLPPDAVIEPHPPLVEHSGSAQSSLATASTSTPTTTRPRKPKPLFTMIKGDKFSSSSESIIESPTTGKDYVFPLVLLIFAIPGTVFFIKFLYKRGTEFTERQQYHRMYLIDGMYNAR